MIEDFSGPYELSLFGKDYEAYKPKVQLHASIFVKGEIKEKYALKPEERAQGKTAPYDFRLSDINLLGNVTDQFVSAITLNVMSGQVDAKFRGELVRLLKTNKGSIPLLIFIIDPQTGYKIEFKSKQFQVAVDAEFIADIDRLGLTYKISRK
jgi:hypothetical protein